MICSEHAGMCSCKTTLEEKLRVLVKRRIRAKRLLPAQEEYAAAYAGFRIARDAFRKEKENYLRSHKNQGEKMNLRKKIMKLLNKLQEAKKMLVCEMECLSRAMAY